MANTNNVTFSGKVATEPRYLTESHDNKIYEFDMVSVRKSGVEDRIKVNCPSYLLQGIQEGYYIKVLGEFRSYNKPAEEVGKSHTVLTIFAQDIEDAEEFDENEIILEGYLCKPTKYRTTPFGRDITDAILAVNRGNGRSDYIPCIFWGHQAKFLHSKCNVGDNIRVVGRIQSRDYQKKLEDGSVETRTAYEVSVRTFEKVGQEL